MTPPAPVREADQRAAPFVFAYIFLVVGAILAMLYWIYSYRGYA